MGEADPKFQLVRVSGLAIADEELIEDLRRTSRDLDRDTVPQKTYAKLGRFDYSTVIRRFGSWNEALRLAGLSLSNEVLLCDERLFGNLLVLWQHLGRQPRRSDLAQPPSTVSQSPYLRRFGSWRAALESFVSFAKAADADPGAAAQQGGPSARRTGREPSTRLRFRVLQRDRFACRHCGASPASTTGVELHVDHVVAWSKGGETTLENLQTLCSTCNLGKGNLSESSS